MTAVAASEVIQEMYLSIPWAAMCVRKDALTIKMEESYSYEQFRENLKNDKQYQEQLNSYMNEEHKSRRKFHR